jgi:hypothetical protein
MSQKKTIILPLATALVSLTTSANSAVPTVQSPDQANASTDTQEANANSVPANTVFNAGEDLLGLLVTKNADGTIVAQHSSHVSHASHTSHSSSR